MRTLLLTLVLAACSSGTKAPAPPTNQSSSDTTCTTDSDCVVVETACCDHCNGGKAEAFNKAVADAHKPTSCENTTCTLMACGAATASCDAGTCKVTIQPLR
ncbi:MAG: hypothetical protein HOV81_36435 [Kofleriaceae bacterium]|nr:hypothetical protein [Kofleriaceae bacterium]